MATTYNNLYLDIRQQLRRAGIEEATLEARELVCFGTNKSREELARVMGMSVPDMARKFKEEFGESVYSWLLKQKNARILAMLSYPSVTIKDVIYEFKFSSPASFNKYCKTHFGCPPRVLAERIKNEKSAEYAAG